VQFDSYAYAVQTVRDVRPGVRPFLAVTLARAGFLEIQGDDSEIRVEALDGGEGATLGWGLKTVRLRPGHYRVGERTVEIRAGETTVVDLRR
jgi:hypothetical protein